MMPERPNTHEQILFTLEDLCDTWVESGAAVIERHFHMQGFDFNRASFLGETKSLLGDLVRIAIFHGAELSVGQAVTYLEKTEHVALFS